MLESIITILIKFCLWIFSCLPIALFPIVANVIGKSLYALLPRERAIIYHQLKFAFPSWSEQEFLRVGKESFVSLCLLILENINSKKLLAKIQHPNKLTSEETGYFKFKDTCGVNDVYQSKAGAVCLVSHSANFELVAAFYIAKGIPLTVIAREPNYKVLIKIIKDFRTKYGLDLLWREDMGNAKKLLKALKTGRFLVTLIDQDTSLESIYSRFFGLECAHPKGPVSIAVKMNKAIFYAYDTRLSDGSHKISTTRIHWEHLKSEVSHEEIEQFIVDEYSKQLEEHTKQYPTQWVWWHRRWRRIEGGDPLNPMTTGQYIEFLKEKL